MYGPQKVSVGNKYLLRIPDDKGGPGNPSAPIDVNAFHTTNFRSRFAMRGAEFHGNSRRDSTTRIPSIPRKRVCRISIVRQLQRTEIGSTIDYPSALESMRQKSCFRCRSVNIALNCKQ